MDYDLLCVAIKEKKSVSAIYNGALRKFSPHCIGTGKKGEAKVFGYQYGGESSGVLPDWRCFRVDELTSIEINSDEWTSASNHSKPNTCVVNVHLEVAR